MSTRKFYALGTASQVPTRKRNHNGYFLKWDDQGFLFDPGEGTQRQMIHAGISASEITKIFITHFHGDHCLGLPGVLQRISLDQVAHPVEVYFPASGSNYFHNLQNASIYYNTATIEPRPITNEGVIFSDDQLTISTKKLDHTVESWGYRVSEQDSYTLIPEKLKTLGLQGEQIGELKANGVVTLEGREVTVKEVGKVKKGMSFAFVMDTRICPGAVSLASEADVLVAESTYLNEQENEAHSHGHLTAAHAASIARDADARLLVLTHFSQRYPDISAFVEEASSVFANVVAVNDGDSVELIRKRSVG